MKVTKKLVLGKVSIVNLNNHAMATLKGGLVNTEVNYEPPCQNPEIAPATMIITICSGGADSRDVSCN